MHTLQPHIQTILKRFRSLDEVTSNYLTQGIILDVNPFWLHAYQCYRAGIRPYPDPYWREAPFLYPFFATQEIHAGDEIDFSWVDKTGYASFWSSQFFQQSAFQSADESILPFLVKIIAKPASIKDAEVREQLRAISLLQEFPCLLETRPLGRLAASPGDTFTSGTATGTIGGFLKDTNTSKVYAATCGHVIQQNMVAMSGSQQIGTCTHSHAPVAMPANQTCSTSCTVINRLDFALIQMSCTNKSNAVTQQAGTISSHQRIQMRHSTGQVSTFEVGGVTILYSPGNSKVCFADMFEVRPLSSSTIVNPRIKAAFAPIPTQGDSGAWIETLNNEWCGVLVATDHLMGYAIPEDITLREASKSFNLSLAIA